MEYDSQPSDSSGAAKLDSLAFLGDGGNVSVRLSVRYGIELELDIYWFTGLLWKRGHVRR